MTKVINFPLERVFFFGSYDDLPDIARTPEFERDFDAAIKSTSPVPPPEPRRLKLVVSNEIIS